MNNAKSENFLGVPEALARSSFARPFKIKREFSKFLLPGLRVAFIIHSSLETLW